MKSIQNMNKRQFLQVETDSDESAELADENMSSIELTSVLASLADVDDLNEERCQPSRRASSRHRTIES